MKLPSFLVIGAAKSGTYALNAHFSRHPEIHMCPIKEPHFFSFAGQNLPFKKGGHPAPVHDWVDSLDSYLRLFSDVNKVRAAGECSVSYLYWPGTAERIRQFNPDMRLIVSLRHPVDRAYSSFHYAKSYGLESLRTLTEGIQAEPTRIRRNQSLLLRYRDLGLYARQLEPFLDFFPRECVKVVLYDDLVSDQVGTVQQLFEFLGVTPLSPDPLLRTNVTRSPDDNNPLHRFLNGENVVRSAVRKVLPLRLRSGLRHLVRATLFKPPPPIEQQERACLLEVFREDIERLGPLIHRDLTPWLT